MLTTIDFKWTFVNIFLQLPKEDWLRLLMLSLLSFSDDFNDFWNTDAAGEKIGHEAGFEFSEFSDSLDLFIDLFIDSIQNFA